MLNKLAVKVKDSSPIIFTVLAIGGLVGTCILTAKAAVTVDKVVDPDLDKKEKIKVYAKTYGPAVGCGIATVGCMLAANHIHIKKEAALAGVAALWKGRLNDVEEKVIDKHGEEDLKEIHKEIVKDKIKDNPPPKDMILTGEQILVYEPYTGQYIRTTRERIAWAMLRANEKLSKDGDVRLNLIIKMLGGMPTQEGADIGWNIDNEAQEYAWGFYAGPWISIIPEIKTVDDREAFVMFYEVNPDTQEPEQMIWYDK